MAGGRCNVHSEAVKRFALDRGRVFSYGSSRPVLVCSMLLPNLHCARLATRRRAGSHFHDQFSISAILCGSGFAPESGVPRMRTCPTEQVTGTAVAAEKILPTDISATHPPTIAMFEGVGP